MEKGINLATNDLRIKLIEDISIANLPACNVKLILSELLADVSRLEVQAIEKEKIEYANKNKDEKEGK